MKKISLIILISLAAFNSSRPMAKTKMAAKPSAAMAVANAKLQAKPILFFDTGNITVQRESDELGNMTDKILVPSKSIEMSEIESQIYKADKDAILKYSETGSDAKKISDEHNLITSKLYKQIHEVRKKIKTIKEVIAKRLNACAVIDYGGGGFILIDPVYDITQEVFDTLNKEYKESQSKKHACTHCCHAHCPKVH